MPVGVELDLSGECVVSSDAADANAADTVAVIGFVTHADQFDADTAAVLDAARRDRLAWVAYPKARQRGSDLNRDIVADLSQRRGAQPVRAVSIDEVWSALRLRPL